MSKRSSECLQHFIRHIHNRDSFALRNALLRKIIQFLSKYLSTFLSREALINGQAWQTDCLEVEIVHDLED